MITKAAVHSRSHALSLVVCLVLLSSGVCRAEDTTPPPAGASSAEELSKKLANPVASLISVPFQSNFDVGMGPYNGSKMVLNVQPVIPITLTPSWNLITRWIVPIVSQFDVTGDNTDQAGLGDAVLSAFFSPSGSDPIWGVGPAFNVPTATDDATGTGKFAIGPTFVVLKQQGPWTFGALGNHLVSVAGDDDRGEVSATFLNPFVNHSWKSGASVVLNIEYTHDWENDVDVLVVHPLVSGVTKFGNQAASLSIGPRIHFAPDNHPSYGIRAAVVLVFPK